MRTFCIWAISLVMLVGCDQARSPVVNLEVPDRSLSLGERIAAQVSVAAPNGGICFHDDIRESFFFHVWPSLENEQSLILPRRVSPIRCLDDLEDVTFDIEVSFVHDDGGQLRYRVGDTYIATVPLAEEYEVRVTFFPAIDDNVTGDRLGSYSEGFSSMGVGISMTVD